MQYWKTSVKSSIEAHYFSSLVLYSSLSHLLLFFSSDLPPSCVSYVIGSIQKILKQSVPRIKISVIKGDFYSQIYWRSQSLYQLLLWKITFSFLASNQWLTSVYWEANMCRVWEDTDENTYICLEEATSFWKSNKQSNPKEESLSAFIQGSGYVTIVWTPTSFIKK